MKAEIKRVTKEPVTVYTASMRVNVEGMDETDPSFDDQISQFAWETISSELGWPDYREVSGARWQVRVAQCIVDGWINVDVVLTVPGVYTGPNEKMPMAKETPNAEQ